MIKNADYLHRQMFIKIHSVSINRLYGSRTRNPLTNGPMSKKNKQSLHFLTHSSRQAGDWPFYRNMQRPHVAVSVFGNSVSLQYPHRLWLYLIGWPRLFLSGVRLARNSLAALNSDTIVTAHDHILLLAYKFARIFSLKAQRYKLKLVLHGFIYTPRSSSILNKLRGLYFHMLLKNVAMIVCHSKYEAPALEKLIDRNKTLVEPIHYGIGEGDVIKEWYRDYAAKQHDDAESPCYSIVTAGRSSRDYATLVAAVEKLPGDVACGIVCDNIVTAPGHLNSDKVKIHRSVYGAAYTQMLIDANVIVIPLGEGEISAGQMVLLHALAAAKPVIITETPTSREYVEPGNLIKLVPPDDAAAMQTALEDIRRQLPLQFDQRLRLRQLFEARFSDAAHSQAVFDSYQKHLF